MANFITEGNKTVACIHGHACLTPFNTTIFKCQQCDSYVIIRYFGVVVDKSGNYVY